MKMGQIICSLCGGTENKHCFSAFDFDHSVEPYELVQCTGCGLAVTEPVPDPAAMDGYYPEAYYGSGGEEIFRCD